LPPATFSIGILGEGGMGETNLMRIIQNKLIKNNKILTVWFNAWKYEREEYMAISTQSYARTLQNDIRK
jgi:predicted KAP-like P-loop ATPase